MTIERQIERIKQRISVPVNKPKFKYSLDQFFNCLSRIMFVRAYQEYSRPVVALTFSNRRDAIIFLDKIAHSSMHSYTATVFLQDAVPELFEGLDKKKNENIK